MGKPLRNLLFNSTLAFVSAFFVTTFGHEASHFFSHSLFGSNPILFHNYVQAQDEGLSISAKVISALAGPIGSLIQSIIFGVIVAIQREGTMRNLFFPWLSLLGSINFFGYLIITPFSKAGDTGKAADLL